MNYWKLVFVNFLQHIFYMEIKRAVLRTQYSQYYDLK